MTYVTPYKVELQRYPTTPANLVRSVDVQVGWRAGGTLALSFILIGDLARLRIPAPQPPRRADNLWQHTCFEAFLRYPDEPEYCEFNFSPSGEWAAYAFRRYRDGMSPVQGFAPHLVIRRTEERLELDALIWLDSLPLVRSSIRVRLAVSTVIEDEQGALSYWALTHPPGKPDFHHPDSFTLELEWPDAALVDNHAEEGKP